MQNMKLYVLNRNFLSVASIDIVNLKRSICLKGWTSSVVEGGHRIGYLLLLQHWSHMALVSFSCFLPHPCCHTPASQIPLRVIPASHIC